MAKQSCKDPVVLIEQRLDYSAYVPEGFGTGDLLIVAEGTLAVIDLKYGKGVAWNWRRRNLYCLNERPDTAKDAQTAGMNFQTCSANR